MNIKQFKYAIYWVIFIFILIVIPKPIISSVNRFSLFKNFDKIVHFGLFFILAILIFRSYLKLTLVQKIFSLLIVIFYGIILEFIQLLPYIRRSFEMADIVINALGAVSAWLIWEIRLNYKAINQKKTFLIILFFGSSHYWANSQTIPQPPRELRGVWVATVKNIDFPSIKTLSTMEQKEEFIKLLNFYKSIGINSIFVQIRPQADAFYPSQFEPWSEYLTGKQGQAPNPYYDPLAFMIEETHKAGIEFHAWINPYRATMQDTMNIAPNHITKIHPEWFIYYGDRKYFNPGLKEVWDYTEEIVKDIVTRYDIDGFHIDDYFYPYKIANKVFPDYKTFKKFSRGLPIETWRRSNCDTIITRMSKVIKEVNPNLRFGVSPFGVWRNIEKDPKGSKTKAGQTNYDDLYADILLWLKLGLVDYVVPQLYWEKGHKLADFDVLLPWWNKNSYNRQLYIGIGVYRQVEKIKGWDKITELPYQIKDLRTYSSTSGMVFFSSKSLVLENKGWKDSLRQNYFKNKALVPIMDWLPNIKIANPEIIIDNEYIRLIYRGNSEIKSILITEVESGKNSAIVKQTIQENELIIPRAFFNKEKKYYAFALGRYNHLSEGMEIKIP